MTARLWDAGSGKDVAVLRGHEGAVWSATFSLDGRRVLTASEDMTARLWDTASAKEIVLLRGHEDAVVSVTFSPDGGGVLTASGDTTARLWDVGSGKEVAVLCGHEGQLTSATFSPDGRRVLTASSDATARLWRVFLTTEDLVDETKQFAPRGLTTDEREREFLEPEPPALGVEVEKYPFGAQARENW